MYGLIDCGAQDGQAGADGRADRRHEGSGRRDRYGERPATINQSLNQSVTPLSSQFAPVFPAQPLSCFVVSIMSIMSFPTVVSQKPDSRGSQERVHLRPRARCADGFAVQLLSHSSSRGRWRFTCRCNGPASEGAERLRAHRRGCRCDDHHRAAQARDLSDRVID